jgi:hypothetical protein
MAKAAKRAPSILADDESIASAMERLRATTRL